ncbi:MAG: TIGR03905 family TSCPD domain-containing protein [Clostridiales bacterium]|nr:TIGR03905 family TSCPD domain-containing protein [Clostridiales bacterium]
MAKYTFTPQGVCSSQIEFEIDNGVVRNCKFTRGCNGNTQGIGALVEGMKADEVIKRLKGVNCGGRGTSCPDQLARALEQASREQ